MADDLYAAVTARIDELERIAKMAQERPWTVDVDGPIPIRAGLDFDIVTATWPQAKHAVNWDPATVLRGLAEDRDILARHRPSEFVTIWEHGGRYPQCTHGCPDDEAEFAADAVRWDRCPEVLSLARRHGIEVPTWKR